VSCDDSGSGRLGGVIAVTVEQPMQHGRGHHEHGGKNTLKLPRVEWTRAARAPVTAGVGHDCQ
jgi:hypothetical protein